MTVGQMLAHCNNIYELDFEDKHSKPNFFMKFILKIFIKKGVVNDVPFKKNIQTASYLRVSEDKTFEIEKQRLIAYINKTQELGANHFDNKESHSFGPLSVEEWNNMLYKHLDHHLCQFDV